MKNLQKEYGGKEGKNMYFAMEQKAGGSPTNLRSALKEGKFSKKKNS